MALQMNSDMFRYNGHPGIEVSPYASDNMSSIVESLKDKLSTKDKQSGNPQAGDATADPRGHQASSLPFSTKQGQNEQDFPGEVPPAAMLPQNDMLIWEMPCFLAGAEALLYGI